VGGETDYVNITLLTSATAPHSCVCVSQATNASPCVHIWPELSPTSWHLH